MNFSIEEITALIDEYWAGIDPREFPDVDVALGRLRSRFAQRNREKKKAEACD
jgi:hypothetical protein